MSNRSFPLAVTIGLCLLATTAQAAIDPDAPVAPTMTTTTVTTTVGDDDVAIRRTETTTTAAPELATPPPAGETTSTTTTVEAIEDRDEHVHWFGLSLGAVASPLGRDGRFTPGSRVTSDPFRACLDPVGQKHCSSLRGFDVRLQFYRAKNAWEYPRWIGYFRTGYGAGVASFDPHDGARIAKGDATSLSYVAVPLFFGGSVYAFKHFPIRPYAGAGIGFDVVRLRYTRKDERPLNDASLRFGFELHAGIEARISNVVALTAEVQQLWSVRRRLPGVPDYSNQGLTVMAGVAISIPSRIDRQMWKKTRRVTTVTRRADRPAPAITPTPVIVAPAPVVIAPAPAPTIITPAPAPTIVAPTTAPTIVAPTVVTPPTAGAPVVAPPVVTAPAATPAPATTAPPAG